MVEGTPEKGEDFFRQQFERLSEEEALRRQAEYTQGRRRFEILRSCETPEGVLLAARQLVAGEEAREITEPPNRYTRDSVDEILQDRKDEAQIRLKPETLSAYGLEGLIFGAVIDKEGQRQVGKENLTPEQLKRLIDGLDLAQKEFWARWRLLEAYRQHRMAGMDLEQITVGLFTSLGKVYPEAGYLAIIGRAKETLPGAEKLGVMVDKAMRAWCDIGEGKVAGIPNIFGGPRFESTYQEALDYVTARIIGSVGKNIPPEERKYNLYWQDAQAAARLALEIFRLFDLDVTYDLNCKDISPEEEEKWLNSLKAFLLHFPGRYGKCKEYDFKGGMNSGDLAKICHFILRQTNEFGRDNPRQSGAPAVVGCFPNLTVNFMRMITVEARTKDGKVSKKINLWTLWREKEIPFGDLPWGEAVWDSGVRILKEKGLLPAGAKEEEWEVSGIDQDVYDVPYTLQHFYAVGTVFSAITRKDLDKAFEDCRNPNYLYALNKGFENTFGLMADGLGLSKKTMTKIRQLAKVNFLIGVLVANTPDNKSDIRRWPSNVTARPTAPPSFLRKIQLPRIYGEENDVNLLVDDAIEAAEQAGFLSSSSDPEQLEREKRLLALAVGKYGLLRSFAGKRARRRGFLPSETGWFSKEELEAIKNSGLYGPYDKV